MSVAIRRHYNGFFQWEQRICLSFDALLSCFEIRFIQLKAKELSPELEGCYTLEPTPMKGSNTTSLDYMQAQSRVAAPLKVSGSGVQALSAVRGPY
jgi:hypothetical protein